MVSEKGLLPCPFCGLADTIARARTLLGSKDG